MDYKKIFKDIKDGKEKSLYLFYGRENYLIDKVLKKIQGIYINGNNKSFNYIVIDGENIQVDSLIDACETVPFIGEKRIVIVKEAGLFSAKKNVIPKEDEERLINYFSNMPNTTLLFFVEGSNIDKRKKIVNEVKKHGDIIQFDKLSSKELGKWIKRKFEEKGKNISLKLINRIIEIINYENKDSNKTLYDIENEIIKISSFIGHEKNSSIEDIEKILAEPLDTNIFSLVDAVAEKNGDLAFKILNQILINGEPEARILHMIVRQFKLIYTTKLMLEKGYTPMAIAPKLSLPQYITKKYVKQSNAFTSKEILKIKNNTLKIDRDIKTGKMSPKLGLEVLIAQCCEL